MLDLLAAGLLLGLSSGIQCSVACLPLLLTQLTGGKTTPGEGVRIALLFSVGRLLVYFFVAYVLFYSLGFFGTALRNPLSESLSSLLLGVIMVYYCYRAMFKRGKAACNTGIQKRLIRLPFTSVALTAKPGRNGTSLLLGVISSLNVCLPLVALISLSALTNLGATFASVSMFWLGSSVYSFGLALMMAGAARIRMGAALRRRVGFIGSLSGMMFGAFLVLAGIASLAPL
ncbi:MAG TPA: sulfite exporter TauE/SafE family protein [Conexivisphaerales archaeon]|nr:sulfite exporter TauE/SafE family protein [Conexivisphaerales archaeon]